MLGGTHKMFAGNLMKTNNHGFMVVAVLKTFVFHSYRFLQVLYWIVLGIPASCVSSVLSIVLRLGMHLKVTQSVN